MLEYDQKGNNVWSYHISKYALSSDLINHAMPGGINTFEMHDNAFCFDEETKSIYISFKRISRILKIRYPEGTVINTYGHIYRQGDCKYDHTY